MDQDEASCRTSSGRVGMTAFGSAANSSTAHQILVAESFRAAIKDAGMSNSDKGSRRSTTRTPLPGILAGPALRARTHSMREARAHGIPPDQQSKCLLLRVYGAHPAWLASRRLCRCCAGGGCREALAPRPSS